MIMQGDIVVLYKAAILMLHLTICFVFSGHAKPFKMTNNLFSHRFSQISPDKRHRGHNTEVKTNKSRMIRPYLIQDIFHNFSV